MERLLVVRCPALLAEDEGGDLLRRFTKVIGAARTYCPWVTAVAPGICTLPARGPARLFGGETEVIRLVIGAVEALDDTGPVEVGIADGLFAALLAAQAGVIVPPGGSAPFLAPWPMSVLERPELTELLQRLGLRTLGALAELPERHVLARLGIDSVICHRVARGLDGELPGLRRAELQRRLDRDGQSGRYGATAVRQAGFWGGREGADLRAAGSLADVQRLLGPETVMVAHLQGGRSPSEQVRFVTWAHPQPSGTGQQGQRQAQQQDKAKAAVTSRPWPGQLPSPAPALVHRDPPRVELLGADDRPVRVTNRGTLSTRLARLSIGGDPWSEVIAWAGPWPTWERWWTPSGRRSARLQVVTASGLAHLLTAQQGSWRLTATYD